MLRRGALQSAEPRREGQFRYKQHSFRADPGIFSLHVSHFMSEHGSEFFLHFGKSLGATEAYLGPEWRCLGPLGVHP